MRTCYFKPLGGIVTVALLLMTACQSVSTRVFTVEPVVAASVASQYNGPPIRIDAVHIPPALDRIEILREVAPGEFEVSDLDHWVAPLGQVIRQTLTEDLIARLPQGRVIFPNLAKPAGTIGVSVDLLELSATRDGARLQVSWVGTSVESQPRSCGGTMVLRTALAGAGSAAMASALSTLLSQLADRIVAELLLMAPVEPAR
jgi:uncharacterized protein